MGKRHKPEEIIGKLREAETVLAQGGTTADACRRIAVLVEILEEEAKLPRRERRSTQRLFETLRGRGYEGAHDSVHRFVKARL